MSSCTDFQEKASLILDGELIADSERVVIEQHLDICAVCNLDHALDKATRSILRQRFPMVETPVNVRHSIQSFIAAQL